MKVLVIGGGGREHAIVWKLAQDKRIDQLFCIPGNAGIAQLAECIPYSVTDIEGVVAWVKEHEIDLTFEKPSDVMAMLSYAKQMVMEEKRLRSGRFAHRRSA